MFIRTQAPPEGAHRIDAGLALGSLDNFHLGVLSALKGALDAFPESRQTTAEILASSAGGIALIGGARPGGGEHDPLYVMENSLRLHDSYNRLADNLVRLAGHYRRTVGRRPAIFLDTWGFGLIDPRAREMLARVEAMAQRHYHGVDFYLEEAC